MKKRKNVELKIDEGFVQGAVREGILRLSNRHEALSSSSDFLFRHIDMQELNKCVGLAKDYVENNLEKDKEENKKQFTFDFIADYVSEGKLFDENAQQMILRKKLEEKEPGFFTKIFGRSKSDLDKIDLVSLEFKEVYKSIKKKGYLGSSKINQKLLNIYHLGFLDSSLYLLKGDQLIDEEDVGKIRAFVSETIEGNLDQSIRKINWKGKRIVASVLGLFGVGLLISNGMRVTGAVIGSSEGLAFSSVVGVGLIVCAMFLGFDN